MLDIGRGGEDSNELGGLGGGYRLCGRVTISGMLMLKGTR